MRPAAFGRVQSAPANRPLCVDVAARGAGGRGPLRPRFGGSGGGGPKPPPQQSSSLSSSLGRLQVLWRSVKPQTVQKDPARGIHLAPDTPGSLGRPVRVLTNHVRLSTASPFDSVSRYCVSIAAGGDAPTASSTQPEQPPPDIPLAQREQLLAQLTADHGWEAGSWQYDPASNSLYSRQGASLEEAACSVSLTGQQGRAATTWQISKQPGTAASADNSPMQLLGLLVKGELLATVQGLGGVVGGARVGLLPPGVLWQPSPASSSSGGGGRGGSSGRGGGQRGGGRGTQGGRGGGGRGGLTGGVLLQYWDSLKVAVKATRLGPTLQIDTSAGAVLPAGPLSQLLSAAGADPAQLMRDRQLLAAAQDALKGAKIQLSYFPSGPRSAVVKGLVARSPADYKFTADSKETSVAQHFRTTYGVQLQHSRDWPCVMISKTAAIPLELCTGVAQPRKNLDEQQMAQLIRVAALPPDRRLAAFKTLFSKVLARWDVGVRQWGLSFSQQLLTVDARVLPDASLQFANSQTVDAGNAGAWRPAGRATLVSPAPLKNWAVLNLAARSCSSAGVQVFVSGLMTEMQRQGMACAPPRAIVDGSRHSGTAAAVEAVTEQGGLQLILVVLPSGGGAEYRQVKEAAAERQLVTQCLLASKAGISGASAHTKGAYVANLLLKINAKLGGTNWSLPSGPSAFAPLFRTAQLMVMGVDVGHGLTGSRTPSVAAVVASSDPACSRYSAAILEQTAGHEVVLGMCEAVQGLLQHYSDQGGCLPDALLVYRDGVSDSMYASVLQHEVEGGIRRACQAVGAASYQPKVTFIVTSRSHGTRLMPVSGAPPADSLNRNVLPGTVVDMQLVAPLAYEFFLNSHAGIQGTNRPARFNVLVDDRNIGPDGLQLVTFHLSSIYAACTRTLADPAPARYTDKAARAGGFLQGGSGGAWVEVQAQPGQLALRYRMFDVGLPADTMWYL